MGCERCEAHSRGYTSTLTVTSSMPRTASKKFSPRAARGALFRLRPLAEGDAARACDALCHPRAAAICHQVMRPTHGGTFPQFEP